MGERHEDDDLFEPALAGREAVAPRLEGSRPWRLGSQFYVAFFGGALAVAAIAHVNARRLGLDRRAQLVILGVGLAGLVAAVVVAVVMGDGPSSSIRLAGRIAGVVAWGPMYLLQRSADRVYDTFTPDESYDSLWGPGLAATLGLGLVQLGIVGGIAATA